MKKDLQYYAQKFKTIKVDTAHGIAPHKPILILCVIELIGQNIINKNRIDLSPELIAAFLKYWSLLVTTKKHHSNIHLPFFHLRGVKFWHLKVDSRIDVIMKNFQPKGINSLRKVVEYAYLDNELFDLLQNSANRNQLVQIIINTWFAERSREIDQLFQINSFKEFQDRLKDSEKPIYSFEELKDEGKAVIRDAAFRRNIRSSYNYSCAFCKLRIISGNSQSIVDGSHIKPFAEFRDDRLNNGLSLCKNHHWAFDRGWFSIDDDYRIIISEDLKEDSPNSRPLQDFNNERIYLPSQSIYFPRLDALQWHRENRFLVASRLTLID